MTSTSCVSLANIEQVVAVEDNEITRIENSVLIPSGSLYLSSLHYVNADRIRAWQADRGYNPARRSLTIIGYFVLSKLGALCRPPLWRPKRSPWGKDLQVNEDQERHLEEAVKKLVQVANDTERSFKITLQHMRQDGRRIDDVLNVIDERRSRAERSAGQL